MVILQAEIIELLEQGRQGDRTSLFKDLKKYIGTSYELIGLSSPRQKDIFKKGFSFSQLPMEKQLEIWDGLWKTSGQHEIMNLALLFVGKNRSSFTASLLWDTVRSWVEQIDNWAHSDGLSSVYAHLLEMEPELVYGQYEIWNRSANPWERRQSIVGLFYYSKMRKVHLSLQKAKAMLIPLLPDEDYFVQKGVGWTIREMGNVFPEETRSFLVEHLGAISPVAFTAAIEKMGEAQKQALKQARRGLPKEGRKVPPKASGKVLPDEDY